MSTKLKDTALMGDNHDLPWEEVTDPLGYMAETARTADQTILLTSEILLDALRLTHPDAHPPERQELAKRVTQQLLALQPFVFPAEKPKPVTPYDPATAAERESFRKVREELQRGRFPCADCASTIPYFYCAPCRVEWDKRQDEKRERESAKQHKWRAWRKTRRTMGKPPTLRASCGKEIKKAKRKDARFCSDACRQRAHRIAVTDKTNSPENFAVAVTRPGRPHGRHGACGALSQ